MEPIYFESTSALRSWFENNHTTAHELVVGYYKTGTGNATISWSESVDEALCFGWIDGIRKSVDINRYCIRFTPRNPDSNWSTMNIRKVESLIRKGRMQPAGLEVYKRRREDRSGIYSYEGPHPDSFPHAMEEAFKLHKEAWHYYQTQAPSYRKITVRWVMAAKQEATQLKRLDELIRSSEAGEYIKAMRWGKK